MNRQKRFRESGEMFRFREDIREKRVSALYPATVLQSRPVVGAGTEQKCTGSAELTGGTSYSSQPLKN